MAVPGGDGGLVRASSCSLCDAAAFCFAACEEGSSPFCSPQSPPHALLGTGSLLYLCRVASMPGSHRTLVWIQHHSLHGKTCFWKGPENFRAVRREAFSSAKQASEWLLISCCNGSWCQVVFESQRFIIQSHINSTANQICDEKKKKPCNKKIQHRKSDQLLILLRVITVFTSR